MPISSQVKPLQDKSLPSLDPRTLGRPVHRLAVFTERLRTDLGEAFISGLNRRYRATFQLGEIRIARTDAADAAEQSVRWLALASDSGRIAFSIDRGVLAAVLHYRYGLHGSPSVADEPENASEARLGAMLGQQMAEIVARCIDTLAPFSDTAPSASAAAMPFTPMPATAFPHAGSWTVSAPMREITHGIDGVVRFRLDEAWMARLLRQLVPSQDTKAPPTSTSQAGPALGARLQLTLVARLLEQELPLGTLLDMRVGDVLPVRIGRADVLVDQSRLFHADVAEHKGKLCLTSFDDAE